MRNVVLKLEDDEFERLSVICRFYLAKLHYLTGKDTTDWCTPELYLSMGLFSDSIDLSILKDQAKINEMKDFLDSLEEE